MPVPIINSSGISMTPSQYPIERFTDLAAFTAVFGESVNCEGCGEFFRHPWNATCGCTERVMKCVSCIKEQLKTNAKCERCDEAIDPCVQINRELESRIDELAVCCQNEPLGCEEMYELGPNDSGDKEHQAECEYQLILMNCCNTHIQRREQPTHECAAKASITTSQSENQSVLTINTNIPVDQTCIADIIKSIKRCNKRQRAA